MVPPITHPFACWMIMLSCPQASTVLLSMPTAAVWVTLTRYTGWIGEPVLLCWSNPKRGFCMLVSGTKRAVIRSKPLKSCIIDQQFHYKMSKVVTGDAKSLQTELSVKQPTNAAVAKRS